jgi:hypothetical protein
MLLFVLLVLACYSLLDVGKHPNKENSTNRTISIISLIFPERLYIYILL